MASLLPSAATTTAPQATTNTYNSSYNLAKPSFPSPPSSHYSQQQQQVKYQSDMPASSHYSSQSNAYSSQQYQYNGEQVSSSTSTTTASPTTSTMPHSLKASSAEPQTSKPLSSNSGSSSSVSEALTQSQQQHSAHAHQPTQVQPLVLPGQQSAGQFVGNSGLQGNTMLYPMAQQPIYGYDHMEMMQRMLHNPAAAPSTLSGGRDGAGLSSGGYSGQDLAKFRQDQNSSPVPSALGTQGTHGGYLNSANAMHPMYMYSNVVPNNFGQYGPAIIQLPANTASQSSQYQPAKLQYNATPTYYDTQNPGDYKAAYGSGAVSSQNKQPSNSGMSNSVADLPNYKNHLAKSYDKPGSFHTSTPPPFNLAGSGAPYGHTPVYLPTIPPAQHHSTLLHHQLHQDASAPRGPASGQASKPKPSYSGQAFWGSS